LWTQADIDYVTESVERERWGYTRQDIERCWLFEPRGCFIAEIQHKPAGHVFTINYGKTGWVGLLIVNPEQRGNGIGTILMQTAISYLQKTGVETIRLEAVEKAVPLYKRLGFREEFASLRFSKQIKQKEKRQSERSKGREIVNIQENDMDNVAKFDSKHFGASRLGVLRSLYADQPQNCFIASEKRKISGYILGRKIQNAHWIGPWVCENPETAEKLLCACIDSITAPEEEKELKLGMPILNTDGIRLVKKLGFQLTSRSIRMVWGKPKYKGHITKIYGIGGPEKG